MVRNFAGPNGNPFLKIPTTLASRHWAGNWPSSTHWVGRSAMAFSPGPLATASTLALCHRARPVF
eukprot:3783639-Alexandrium_andersonii.AAC.1